MILQQFPAHAALLRQIVATWFCAVFNCVQYCPVKDYVCSACGTPWHVSHLDRQGYLPSFETADVAAMATWHCPRCDQLCCCQMECSGENDTHKCCHLRRKQLKERRSVHVIRCKRGIFWPWLP